MQRKVKIAFFATNLFIVHRFSISLVPSSVDADITRNDYDHDLTITQWWALAALILAHPNSVTKNASSGSLALLILFKRSGDLSALAFFTFVPAEEPLIFLRVVTANIKSKIVVIWHQRFH